MISSHIVKYAVEGCCVETSDCTRPKCEADQNEHNICFGGLLKTQNVHSFSVSETVSQSLYLQSPKEPIKKEDGKFSLLPPCLPVLCCHTTWNEIIPVHITLTLIVCVGNVQLTASQSTNVTVYIVCRQWAALLWHELYYPKQTGLFLWYNIRIKPTDRLFLLNMLLWNTTGGDITSNQTHGLCLHWHTCVLWHAAVFAAVLS